MSDHCAALRLRWNVLVLFLIIRIRQLLPRELLPLLLLGFLSFIRGVRSKHANGLLHAGEIVVIDCAPHPPISGRLTFVVLIRLAGFGCFRLVPHSSPGDDAFDDVFKSPIHARTSGRGSLGLGEHFTMQFAAGVRLGNRLVLLFIVFIFFLYRLSFFGRHSDCCKLFLDSRVPLFIAFVRALTDCLARWLPCSYHKSRAQQCFIDYCFLSGDFIVSICMSERIRRTVLQICKQISFIIERMQASLLNFD